MAVNDERQGPYDRRDDEDINGIIDWLAQRVGSHAVVWVLIVMSCFTIANTMVSFGLFSSNQGQSDDIAALAQSNQKTADQLVKSVCTLRADYDLRIEASKNFLKTHPNGLPAIGLGKGDLLQSQFNMTRTRNALKFVNCDGVTHEPVPPPLPADSQPTT